MSNTLKLRSDDIKKLNEALQKLTISEGATIIQNPLLEADGKFTSIINMDKDFNHNVVNEVDVEEEKSEKELAQKAHLVSEVKSKLRQALENNEEITRLLKKIDKINDDTKTNEWVLNDRENTALLKDKNAEIFKQNENLCLSINDDIHLFGSVRELHDWLEAHNLPVPKGIKLAEATLSEKARVDINNQPSDVTKIADEARDLFKKANDKGIMDVNTLLNYTFNKDNPSANVPDLDFIDDSSESEAEVEECACTTTGDLGMATTYLADKKEESTLEEDWTAPEIFGLIDDKGNQMKFKSIIDGSRAVLKAIAKDPAFGLNSEEKIELTKDELEHWKKMAEMLDRVITIAIPTICKKMANDYVNESIEKNSKRGTVADDVLTAEIKANVQKIFGYELSDDQVAAMLKRNSKGKAAATMDPSMLRTEEQEALVTAAKIAMGQAKELRENVADEIFNSSSLEGRMGYAKYKKFADLVNKKGGIKVVKSHAPAVNELPSKQKAKEINYTDQIYNLLSMGQDDKVKEIIKTMTPDQIAQTKTEIIAKNPRMEKFINTIMGESTQEIPSLGEAFLSSIN